MLIFIYTGFVCETSPYRTYDGAVIEQFRAVKDVPQDYTKDHHASCLINARLFALADKFMVPSLESATRAAFARNWHGSNTTRAYPYNENIARKDEPVIRAVYSSTPLQQRGLRDIVLRSLKVGSSPNQDCVHSRILQQLLLEMPDLAFDMAVHRLFQRQVYGTHYQTGARCSKCTKPNAFVVVSRFGCGCFNGCTKTECRQKWSRDSVCIHCSQLGVLSYPTV